MLRKPRTRAVSRFLLNIPPNALCTVNIEAQDHVERVDRQILPPYPFSLSLERGHHKRADHFATIAGSKRRETGLSADRILP
jgi:hypothetical protein